VQTNFSSVTKSLSLTELDNLQSYKPIGQQLKKIQASDAEDSDQFGWSVAVSNTRIVVGAPGEDTTASGAGSVYIFDINGNQLAKIQASDAENYDYFGTSVAVSDTRIVVGARGEDTTADGAGSAYIFDIDGNQLAKIQAFDPPGTSDAEANDQFGSSVAVSDTRIVVGAGSEDTTATEAGSAYIFDIDGNEIAKIQAFDPPGTNDAEEYDYFGDSVSVSDTRIVVGARYEDTTAPNAGSAYIFDIDGNGIAKIQAFDPPGTSDAQFNDYFGGSVAVSDTRIVVGAIQLYTTASKLGSAYIFSTGFSPFGDLCAYYDLGDPTVLDTNFSWSDYT
jgi:predicted amidohydrolase